mmetsp:Transcript_65080/g.164021  ORF Transcript_65080/g.164021 Transcript_65080/m.164021 type:complete len:314 (-) Transcript_65080:276-1217(-)
MAPVASSADSKLVLPATLIGRLIGRGGATIRELAHLTGCKITIPPRSAESSCANEPVGPEQGEEAPVSISVRSNAASIDAREISEVRCRRAARLLCEKRFSLEKALAKVDADMKDEKEAEDLAWQDREAKEAVGRVKQGCPEDCDDVDVLAALEEACGHEDSAVELLFGGYRAPVAAPQPAPQPQSPYEDADADLHLQGYLAPLAAPQPVRQPHSPKPARPPAEREDFPPLPTNPAAPSNSSWGCALNGKASCMRAATHRQQQVSLTYSEVFPSLPDPLPKPAKKDSAIRRTRVLRQSCQQQRPMPQTIRRRW